LIEKFVGLKWNTNKN